MNYKSLFAGRTAVLVSNTRPMFAQLPKIGALFFSTTTSSSSSSVPLPQLWLQAVRQVDPAQLDPNSASSSLYDAAFLGDKLLGAAAAKYIWHHGLGKADQAVLSNRQAALLLDVALSNQFFKEQHEHLLPHLQTSLQDRRSHLVGTVLEAAVARVYDQGGGHLENAAIDDLAAYLVKNSLHGPGRKLNVRLQSQWDETKQYWTTTAFRKHVSVTATASTKKQAERSAIQQLFEALGLSRVKSLLEQEGGENDDEDKSTTTSTNTNDLWQQTKIPKKGAQQSRMEESEVEFMFNLLHTTDDRESFPMNDDGNANDNKASQQKQWWSSTAVVAATNAGQKDVENDLQRQDSKKSRSKNHQAMRKKNVHTRTSSTPQTKKSTTHKKASQGNLWWSTKS